MSRLDFPQLLSQYMRRIRASAAGVATEIGLSREAVNNWRKGDALPGRKARDKVLAAARYLRLTESETNRLLQAAEFEPEFSINEAREPLPRELSQSGPALASVQRVFERLFDLRPYPILMLLCPAHLGQPPQRLEMLAEAERRFGGERVLHLQPPYSLSAEPADYFSALAAQCGLADIGSDFEFESALGALLKDARPLFVLVSRFEQGDPVQREVLAGILRSLSEMHSGKLFLLICGGAALADLKYLGGDLSLLNIATAERWPEPQLDDVLPRAQLRGLDQGGAARALEASGGHPLLLDAALDLLSEHADLGDAELIDALARFEPLWPDLLPLLASADTRSRLRALLERPSLAPARPFLLDPQLRDLYWANLIVERGVGSERSLQWRCAAIRAAAEAALALAGEAS